MLKRLIALVIIASGAALLSRHCGLSPRQSMAIFVFSMSILGSLLFWDFRLTFVFIGTSVLLMTRTLDLEHMIKYSSLEVILFHSAL